jgi:GxxExxY protein
MPITSPVSLRVIEQAEFAKLDYHVMRHAFDSQNELGRLCDEVIYQNDLAARLEAAGLGPIRKEVPVIVTHRDFSKTYSLDLVVGDAAIYELKTAVCLAPEHDSQLLNYLFLLGAHHGKLINFRPAQVETRFINTGLTPDARRSLEINKRGWREADDGSKVLRETIVALLEDWGAFLEIPLYLDALVHFLGGEKRVIQRLPLSRKGVPLGSQRFHLAGPGTAFRLTALTDDKGAYEQQLRSLLRHSPLHAIQWINMAHHRIEFATLVK